MEDKSFEALRLVKTISNLVLEHEGSKTVPTTVHISRTQRDLISKEFPYLISGEIYKEGKAKLKIMLTEEATPEVGVGYTYFSEIDLEK
jgi:hypothetical protein